LTVTFLHLVNLRQHLGLLVKAAHLAVACVGHLGGGLETNVALLGWEALEILQRCRDFIFFNNLD